MSFAFQGTGKAFQRTGFAFQQNVPAEGGGGPDRKDNLSDYWYWLEKAREFLRKQRELKQRIIEDAQAIPDERDRETSILLRQLDAKAEEKGAFRIVQAFADKRPDGLSGKMQKLVRQAAEKRTDASLSRLQLEMAKTVDDEEAIVMALLMLD